MKYYRNKRMSTSLEDTNKDVTIVIPQSHIDRLEGEAKAAEAFDGVKRRYSDVIRRIIREYLEKQG